MPLLRLPLVTETLLNVIEESITSSPEWPVANVLNVSPQPPDRLAGDHTVGLYLYHASEDPTVRNAEVARDPSLPQRHTPMGLRLSYVLTAHSDQVGDAATIEEQFLIGLAMRALRDWPILTDTTQVEGTTVFPSDLLGRGNRIHVCEDMLDANAAIDFWSAGSQPLRLAAYYQVSAVLIEPQPGPRQVGPVLNYGVHTFVRGVPRLASSRNRIDVTLPDGSVSRIELRPAQAAVDGTFELLGSDLNSDDTSLQVQHADWQEPATVDTTLWGITSSETVLTGAVRSHADQEVMLPGVYSATATAASDRTMPDGSTRRFHFGSNATPFTVVPRIDGIGTIGADQRLTGGRFDPDLLADAEVRLFVGLDELERVQTNAQMAVGRFRLLNAGEIRFRHTATAAPGAVEPLRLLIRGAESAPRWVTIP